MIVVFVIPDLGSKMCTPGFFGENCQHFWAAKAQGSRQRGQERQLVRRGEPGHLLCEKGLAEACRGWRGRQGWHSPHWRAGSGGPHSVP